MKLTIREQQVYDIFLETGCSNKQIAVKMNIGEQEVKKLMSKIFAKKGLKSRAELFLYHINKPAKDAEWSRLLT